MGAADEGAVPTWTTGRVGPGQATTSTTAARPATTSPPAPAAQMCRRLRIWPPRGVGASEELIGIGRLALAVRPDSCQIPSPPGPLPVAPAATRRRDGDATSPCLAALRARRPRRLPGDRPDSGAPHPPPAATSATRPKAWVRVHRNVTRSAGSPAFGAWPCSIGRRRLATSMARLLATRTHPRLPVGQHRDLGPAGKGAGERFGGVSSAAAWLPVSRRATRSTLGAGTRETGRTPHPPFTLPPAASPEKRTKPTPGLHGSTGIGNGVRRQICVR